MELLLIFCAQVNGSVELGHLIPNIKALKSKKIHVHVLSKLSTIDFWCFQKYEYYFVWVFLQIYLDSSKSLNITGTR